MSMHFVCLTTYAFMLYLAISGLCDDFWTVDRNKGAENSRNSIVNTVIPTVYCTFEALNAPKMLVNYKIVRHREQYTGM